MAQSGDLPAGWHGARSPVAAPLALGAMAHPVRRHLLRLLAERGEVDVATVRRELGLSKPAVVYHTRVLSGAELIGMRKRGRAVAYVARPASITGLCAELEMLLDGPLDP